MSSPTVRVIALPGQSLIPGDAGIERVVPIRQPGGGSPMSVIVPAAARVTTEQLHSPARGRRHPCGQRHDIPDPLGPWPAPVVVRGTQPEAVEFPVDRGRAVRDASRVVDRRDGVAGFVPRVGVRVVAVGNVVVIPGHRTPPGHLILEVGDAAVHRRLVPGERDLRVARGGRKPRDDRIRGARLEAKFVMGEVSSLASGADAASDPYGNGVTAVERRRNLVPGRADRKIRIPIIRIAMYRLVEIDGPPAQVGVLRLIPDQGGLPAGRVPFQRGAEYLSTAHGCGFLDG